MAKTTKIYAPNREYSGLSAGVQFANGVGETDNDAALAYFARAGYGIGKEPPAYPAKPPAFEPALPAEVRQPPSNDAAVQKDAGGPVSDAFLPPTNAGEAEPHGPLVVSPGIHGVGPAPIRPGEVYVDDLPRQEQEETELAQRVLVDHEPATIVATMDESGDVSDAKDLMPGKSANKAAWVEFAASRGMDRDKAEDLSKAEIAKAFGTPEA